MDNHGAALLTIIHDVYPPPAMAILAGNTGNAKISEGNLPSASSATSNIATTSSDSKIHVKPQVKKGPGNQRCSACQGFGHNSMYITPHPWYISTYLVL